MSKQSHLVKGIKEFEVANAKADETKVKVENIDMSVFLPKKEAITKEEINKHNELKEYQKMRGPSEERRARKV